MANENETVEQVALSDRPLAEQIRIIRGNYSIGSGEFDALDEAADVVEFHKREIAERDGERKGLLKANESFAADNTRLRGEIAAKDAEIARLKREVTGLQLQMGDDDILKMANDIDRKDAEIASLRALVKELADALDGFTCKGDCKKYCVIDEYTKDKEECVHIDNRALVAKAREVLNG